MVGKELELTFDMRAYERAASKLPRRTLLEMTHAFREHGAYFERQMRRRFGAKPVGPFKANPTSDSIVNRTGALSRSLRHEVSVSVRAATAEPVLRAWVGDSITAKYVYVQEYGATIRPKTSKYLTVPMPANLTGAGRPRFERARSLANGRLALINGKLYIGRDEDSEFVPYWILKKEVTVPARMGFRKTWRSRHLRRDRIRRAQDAVGQALKGVGL